MKDNDKSSENDKKSKNYLRFPDLRLSTWKKSFKKEPNMEMSEFYYSLDNRVDSHIRRLRNKDYDTKMKDIGEMLSVIDFLYSHFTVNRNMKEREIDNAIGKTKKKIVDFKQKTIEAEIIEKLKILKRQKKWPAIKHYIKKEVDKIRSTDIQNEVKELQDEALKGADWKHNLDYLKDEIDFFDFGHLNFEDFLWKEKEKIDFLEENKHQFGTPAQIELWCKLPIKIYKCLMTSLESNFTNQNPDQFWRAMDNNEQELKKFFKSIPLEWEDKKKELIQQLEKYFEKTFEKNIRKNPNPEKLSKEFDALMSQRDYKIIFPDLDMFKKRNSQIIEKINECRETITNLPGHIQVENILNLKETIRKVKRSASDIQLKDVAHCWISYEKLVEDIDQYIDMIDIALKIKEKTEMIIKFAEESSKIILTMGKKEVQDHIESLYKQWEQLSKELSEIQKKENYKEFFDNLVQWAETLWSLLNEGETTKKDELLASKKVIEIGKKIEMGIIHSEGVIKLFNESNIEPENFVAYLKNIYMLVEKNEIIWKISNIEDFIIQWNAVRNKGEELFKNKLVEIENQIKIYFPEEKIGNSETIKNIDILMKIETDFSEIYGCESKTSVYYRQGLERLKVMKQMAIALRDKKFEKCQSFKNEQKTLGKNIIDKFNAFVYYYKFIKKSEWHFELWCRFFTILKESYFELRGQDDIQKVRIEFEELLLTKFFQTPIENFKSCSILFKDIFNKSDFTPFVLSLSCSLDELDVLADSIFSLVEKRDSQILNDFLNHFIKMLERNKLWPLYVALFRKNSEHKMKYFDEDTLRHVRYELHGDVERICGMLDVETFIDWNEIEKVRNSIPAGEQFKKIRDKYESLIAEVVRNSPQLIENKIENDEDEKISIEDDYTQISERDTLTRIMVREGDIYGEFIIREVIGKGGMAVIRRTEMKSNKKNMALKIIPDSVVDDKNSLRLLKNEFENAKKVTHPNVVRHNKLEHKNGLYFIVMEYIDGKNLLKYLEDQNKEQCSEIWVIKQMLTVAKGLKAIQDKDILHMDLKPQNIMITKKNEVKILDFSISRVMGTKSTDPLRGTIYYMAPEALDSEKYGEVNKQTDIWSLGATMYHLLSGEYPFRKEEIQDDSYLPHKIDSISENCWQIILNCLQRDRSKRYKNIDCLMRDLVKLNDRFDQLNPFEP
jgi:hypothetical protein